MGLEGKNVLITGASMGIGEAIATSLAAQGANLVLLSRSERNLATLANKLSLTHGNLKIIYRAADVGDFESVDKAIASAVDAMGHIDILINNAGLALGAPATFPELKIQDIMTMANTNVNGMMFVTHSVLNRSMMKEKPGKGTILNITSVTGLEVPPFPGEAVYHASKAFQEAFTNSIRNELVETNIKVLALRPGVVTTNFHAQRVGHDKEKYDSFIEGYDPLVSDDVAQAAVYMLHQPAHVSIKALDVVPTAQRSLNVFDRKWAERDH
ncbi:short chain dehydrogenase reductase family [Colletotrichum karsti]|uniref:Short chain dehydrogenase reductase family n=1 Tax=Colletotrichum karsti TaxID=1095194 RepID=A0A9P6LG10_9PEZI|nr:short chain dehydrogenase reductase family [Colletotrichum karsti]KAF9871140.1 short chain dehydrogenase reductase family [Colletotrichum karsti]